MTEMIYNVGDRCPKCGQHIDRITRDLPVAECGDHTHPVPMGELEVRLECPRGHRWPPHERWLSSPLPTVVYAP